MTNALLSLRTRAIVVVALVLVSLVVLAGWVAARADAALLKLDAARFDAQSAQLAESVSYAVLARSAALLDEPLAAFARGPDLVSVQVLDDGGAPIAERAGPRRPSAHDVTVRSVVRTRALPPGAADDPFAAELAAEPRDVGAVVATFSSEATARVQRETRSAILLAVAAVGAIALLAVGLLITSVVRRIRALQSAAARVRAGDLTVSVVDRTNDELGSLAQDFNAMTAAIETQRHALAERESLAALGRATAVIAHELKNPLGIVLGAAHIVADDQKPLAARKEAAGIVLDETRRLASTLDDLLGYAKPRAPRVEEFDAHALCARVIERVQLEGGPAHGVAVTLDGAAASVRADAAQLERALWNLMQNAAQAGASRIGVSLVRAGARVVIDVKDDGGGVADDVREQLFVPFSTTKQRGTGLGLAGARRALREVGGELRYGGAGIDGRGASFVVELEVVG